MKIIITRKNGNTPLNNIWLGEFCGGVKCVQFSNRCWTVFNNIEDAEKYIIESLKSLDLWIKKDIQKQAKDWRKEDVIEFLEKSEITYLKIKKLINSLVIKTNLKI